MDRCSYAASIAGLAAFGGWARLARAQQGGTYVNQAPGYYKDPEIYSAGHKILSGRSQPDMRGRP